MDHAELLALYDLDQRKHIEWPGQRREATEHVIRQINLTRPRSYVIYSMLTADNADAVIQAEKAYFAGLGHQLEWNVYAHDTPADLDQRLAAAGFELVEREAIMALDTQASPLLLDLPPSPAVRRVDHPDQAHTILDVQRAVWGNDFQRLANELAETLRTQPDQLSIFAAYVDDLPVSSAWVRYLPGCQFASLWGGSTLEGYRGQGHYKALLAARVQEAVRRGYRFLTVEASPMSEPILKKHGFQVISWARECVWPAESPA